MKRIDRVLKYKGSIVDVYDDVMQSGQPERLHIGITLHTAKVRQRYFRC